MRVKYDVAEARRNARAEQAKAREDARIKAYHRGLRSYIQRVVDEAPPLPLAIDDPVKLARAARIVRVALDRQAGGVR